MILLLLVLHNHQMEGSSCEYGTTESLPGSSCVDIIDTEPDCYGNNDEYYIQKDTSSSIEQVYCDMTYKNGGWRRVLNYHSNVTNTYCPYNFTDAKFFSNTENYCWRGTNDYVIYTWNSDEDIEFNEIRGYVTLRAKTNGVLDAFDENSNRLIEVGTLDGIEIQAGVYPGGLLRSYYSYVVGTKTTGPCPVNGGAEDGINRQHYRDGAYACDEIEPTGTKDSEGFLDQELFSASTCVQCPAGTPWFEKRYAEVMQDRRVNVRMVNGDDTTSEQLYLTDIEIYVR